MLDSAARPRTEVGALAAEYLRENVSTDARVGIAWSRSTQALVERLHDLPRCTIVQLCGVIDHAAGEEQNVQLMRRAALFAKRGAVAETCGILIAGDGRPLRDGLQKRTVAVTEAQLRRAGDVIALVSEPHRTPAIRALARSRIVDTLITHRAVAERLLADQQ